MRNNAQRDLEAMLPDLDALFEKRLFTKEELKRVLDKRATFEYAIRSSTRTRRDFYRYIEFEEKLEQLRKLRAARLRKKGERVRKSDLCDYCIVRHIHALFSRATFIFKSDLELWKQWFRFCRHSNALQRLSKTLSDALRHNPHAVEIWIYAAQWEFRDCQNTKMARSLMQQAVRNCRLSETLWLEYFKMELSIAQQLWERQQVLVESDETRKEGGLEGLLDGSMALCVFREATKTLPSNFEFRKRFLDIVAESSLPRPEKLNAKILGSIQKDFGDKGETWDVKARFEFSRTSSLDLVSRIEHVMRIYAEGLECGDATAVYSYTIIFLADLWKEWEMSKNKDDVTDVTVDNMVEDALFQQMESTLSTALENGHTVEDAIASFAEICRKQGDIACLLRILRSATEKCPHSESIGHMWIDVVKENHLRNESPIQKETEDDLMKILRREDAMANTWRHVIDAFCELQLPLSRLLRLHFQRTSGVVIAERRRKLSTTSCHFLNTLRERGLLQEALTCAQKCLDCPIVDLEVHLEIIDFFASQLRLKCSFISFETLKRLLEKAVRAHGASNVEIWIALVKFEHEFGDKRIGVMYQRALHSGIQDLRKLEDAMRDLQ